MRIRRDELSVITVVLPKRYVRDLDRLVYEMRLYASRNEAVSDAIRDLIEFHSRASSNFTPQKATP